MTVASDDQRQSLPVDESYVILTRRRWAWMFVPVFVVATVLGTVASLATSETRFLIAPAFVAALWWYIRRNTPVSGMRDRRLSACPEIIQLMKWGAFCLVLFLLVNWGDRYANKRSFGSPYQAYHIVLYGPILIIFFTVVFVIARRGDRRIAAERNQRQAKPAAAPEGRGMRNIPGS